MSTMPPPPPDMPPPPPPPPPGPGWGGAPPPTGMPYGQNYGAPPGWTPTPGPVAALAEWWQRGLAVVIDLVVTFVVAAPLSLAFGGPAFERSTNGGSTRVQYNFGGAIASLVVWIVYAGLLNGIKGQTLGKMALGIKVVRKDTGALLGAGAGLGRAAVHNVLWQVCCIPGLLDSLWPLWDKERQSWHDKVVNSVVVKSR